MSGSSGQGRVGGRDGTVGSCRDRRVCRPAGRLIGSGRPGQLLVQAVPLRLKPVGAAELPVWVAWNPKLVVPPAGIEAL